MVEYIIPGEEEGGQNVADLGVSQIRIGILDFLKHGLFHVEDMVLLIVITDMDFGTQGNGAGICRKHAVDDF